MPGFDELRPANPSEEWPEVTFGGYHKPYVDRSQFMDELLVAPKEPVQFGTVEGLPWSLVACRTREGLSYQLFLGGMGEHGGGAAGMASLPKGHHLGISAILFGGTPSRAITAYVGAVTLRVASAEVQLFDGRSQELDIWPPPTDFLPFFVCFPPYGAGGVVFARDNQGQELERLKLFDQLVPYRAVAAIQMAFEPGSDSS